MATHEITQGDSYEADYTLTAHRQLDNNWNGRWSIILRSEFGSDSITPLSSGLLTKSSDNRRFQLRIPPTGTYNIPVGARYMLIVEATNLTIEFNREIVQDSLVIKPQGVRL